jgi:hypothetical protein
VRSVFGVPVKVITAEEPLQIVVAPLMVAVGKGLTVIIISSSTTGHAAEFSLLTIFTVRVPLVNPGGRL